MSGKPKGWKGEKQRHSMASKGVKSKDTNIKYQIDLDYKKDIVSGFDINNILTHYAIAGLWTSYDSEIGEYLDKNYSYNDIASETLKEMKEDITQFIKENTKILKESGMEESQIGHDFWLSRNHHGAGFFDRGLNKEFVKVIMDATHKYPERYLYVGNDGKIYQE